MLYVLGLALQHLSIGVELCESNWLTWSGTILNDIGLWGSGMMPMHRKIESWVVFLYATSTTCKMTLRMAWSMWLEGVIDWCINLQQFRFWKLWLLIRLVVGSGLPVYKCISLIICSIMACCWEMPFIRIPLGRISLHWPGSDGQGWPRATTLCLWTCKHAYMKIWYVSVYICEYI